MSKQKWDSLPPEVQKVFDEVSPQWIPKAALVWDTADAKAKDYILKMGNEIIPLSKEENARLAKAVQPVVDEYVQAAEAKGLPGKEYVKTIRELIDNYKD
jgi:TRAP-type C4-dicarboxylate transport system substrate-binding protein